MSLNDYKTDKRKQLLIMYKASRKNSQLLSEIFKYLSKTDRTSRQKTTKDMKDLNSAINQFNLINIFITLYINNSNVCILVQCAWDIYQDRSYSGL